MMKIEQFSAFLTGVLEADEVTLQLSKEATADLMALLTKDGDFIYAGITGAMGYECVRIYRDSDALLVERACEGTTAVKHPYGARVCSVTPAAVAVMKELICTHKCCEDSECPCDPVKPAGFAGPALQLGVPWEGSVVFSGALPMSFGITGVVPAWLKMEYEGSVVKLSGTPDSYDDIHIIVSAANCGGTHVAAQQVTFANVTPN